MENKKNDKDENISELLDKYRWLDKKYKELEKIRKQLQIKIKIYLKERKWDRYNDKTGVSVTISEYEREDIDKNQLKIILSDTDYETVVMRKTIEKMLIVTPEQKRRMSSYVKKNKGVI